MVAHCRSTFIVGWHGVGGAIGKECHTIVETQEFAKITNLLQQSGWQYTYKGVFVYITMPNDLP